MKIKDVKEKKGEKRKSSFLLFLQTNLATRKKRENNHSFEQANPGHGERR